MKRNLIFLLSFFLLVIGMFAIALYVPNSLPADHDVGAIYGTDLALVHRIPIYDVARVEALAVEHSGISAKRFFMPRFPYPPWYALSTFYLGWLPIRAATTLWFELNLVMLFLSVWLLTDGWPGRLRLVAFPLALFFLPVLGVLAVGQYDFPLLLGTSLLIYSLRKENIAGTALGAVLLTFKPHIGVPILLSAMGWLIASRSSFGRGAIRAILIAGVFLFFSGFLADPAWVISYPKMLLNYRNEGNVSTCSECASLPVWLSRWFWGTSLASAVWITLALLLLLVIIFYFVRPSFRAHELLLSAVTLIILLVSPYLYNYDFLLLLVPFAVLIHRENRMQKIIVAICYLVPEVSIILYGRAGNISLLFATLVMTALVYLRIRRPRKPVIDFTAPAA
jgi:hypothetical protein